MRLLEKAQLRALMLKRRRKLSEEERKRFSEGIVDRIVGLSAFAQARNPVLFYPFDKEPDITPLFSHIMERVGSLILPKVVGDALELYRIKTTDSLSVGAFRILEPSEGEKVNVQEVDFILVPGVAFDKRGNRLGFGKGYYDKLLPKIKNPKVGVCYSFQIVDELPTDPWDVRVDLVVTEEFIMGGGKVL